jgi:hypothetical protein
MKNSVIHRINIWILLIATMVAVTACAPESPEVIEELTPSPTLTDTTPELTEEKTEVPKAQERVILAYSPSADPFMLTQTQDALELLTVNAGMALESVQGSPQDLLSSSPKLVVLVGEGLDPAGLAQGFPAVQFIVIDDPTVTASSNVSVIGGLDDPQKLAFLGGYLSALISSDYKVSALVVEDAETAERLAGAFVVGARYFCGICQPKYPPYNTFPRWESLPVDAVAEEYRGIVDAFAVIGTEIIYIEKSLVTPEMLSYLGELGIKVVSNGTPDVLVNHWVGTLQADPAPGLQEIWSEVLSGSGGLQAPISIELMDTDSGWVSEGRYRMFEETKADLEANFISFEPVP